METNTFLIFTHSLLQTIILITSLYPIILPNQKDKINIDNFSIQIDSLPYITYCHLRLKIAFATIYIKKESRCNIWPNLINKEQITFPHKVNKNEISVEFDNYRSNFLLHSDNYIKPQYTIVEIILVQNLIELINNTKFIRYKNKGICYSDV
ncbi:hypothetical protein V1477_008552 [Vespula maculifrons]|uniref:Uncharacterized protein n=1 Tax=Vespula maculifrons TaxID=7453 RepID=A0ABD2CDC6_VESMC